MKIKTVHAMNTWMQKKGRGEDQPPNLAVKLVTPNPVYRKGSKTDYQGLKGEQGQRRLERRVHGHDQEQYR
jgi:hypothetical protein